MNKSSLLISAVVMLAVLISGCSRPNPEGIHSYTELKALFADPPSEYRSAPLWDWNDKITEEGIAFQMEQFKKAGIGGVFVHPRPGLLTEYLSDEWFDLFHYAVQKGKELDMKVWIYDENSYPSGFAGGHVPAQMPDSYQHGAGLSMEVQQKLNVTANDTLAVVLKQTENGFQDITANLDQEKGQTGNYFVFRKTYPQKSPWYGGFTYVDLLYKGVTEKFIEVTMTKGYERDSADFGQTLPGIFTDEPNVEAAMSRGTVLRWTPDLWEAFQQRWGYDLKVNLPSLVEETGNWKKVRHDYYELILELFVDRWAKPWSAYCDEKGLKWTGHYWEHGWPEPTHGFDEAAFYIWHQQPGVDMLGNKLDERGLGGQFGNDRAVRELRSAANQAGRVRTLSETYGGGGWDMTFETQKRLVDWQCVLGVNFVNQHLSYYTLKGVRKFDYPPSFSYHEPWWENYRLMGDYIGRVSMAMSAGKQINSILVLQPNTTAWMYFSRKQKNPAIEEIKTGFKSFVYQLEQKHWEYDLGSENVLKELGSVKKGVLTVGRCDYNLVVIPAQMENIDQSTFDLLQQYLEHGGKILSFSTKLSMVDGVGSDKIGQLASQYEQQWIAAAGLDDPAVSELVFNKEFSFDDQTQNGMLYHQRRILDDGQLLFVVNSHQTEKAVAGFSLEGKQVALLDLLSGEVFSYPSEVSKKMSTFQVELGPGESALFAVTDRKADDPEFKVSKTAEKEIAGSGPVQVKRGSDNLLAIHYLDLRSDKYSQKDVYFLEATTSLFKKNGIEMGIPWQHKIQYKKTYLEMDTLFKPGLLEASYHFNMNANLSGPVIKDIRAVVESPELWTVSVNGNKVEKIPDAYWIDKDFAIYAIGQFLKPGKNTLSLSSPRMTILTEVMPVYILGDFLVKPARQGFEITAGDLSSLGSWNEAGMPFYSQKVSYSQTFDTGEDDGCSYKVKLDNWKGSVAEVLVNGEPAGLIAFAPYELDVTDKMKKGTNEITVRVTGSLKNTFGVFFNKNESWIWGPFSWVQAPAHLPLASDYSFRDYGLFEPFKVYCTK
jgi:hypothetical protein